MEGMYLVPSCHITVRCVICVSERKGNRMGCIVCRCSVFTKQCIFAYVHVDWTYVLIKMYTLVNVIEAFIGEFKVFSCHSVLESCNCC